MPTPADRRSEKRGWTWGWIGGFLWLLVLGSLWLLNGQLLPGVCALAGFGTGVVAIRHCAPWRHPRTPYWKLLLPLYAVLFATIALMRLLSPQATNLVGVNSGNLFLLLPMLLPFVILGGRRWDEGDR